MASTGSNVAFMMGFSSSLTSIITSCAILVILSSIVTLTHGLAANRHRLPVVVSTTTGKKQNPLDNCINESVQLGLPTILIVDSNNVRGKDDFQTWNCDLLQKLSSYRRQKQNSQLHIIYAIDHGCQPQAFEYPDGVIVFAGPHRTADDVIVQATRFLLSQDLSLQVVVVTSDGELKQRCMRQTDSGGGKHKRKKHKIMAASGGIKVFGSPSLVSLMKEIDVLVEPCKSQDSIFQQQLSRVESDIRWYTTLHPPFQSGSEQVEAEKHGPWKSDILQKESVNPLFPRKLFQEHTWHRVVVAEVMRRLLEVSLSDIVQCRESSQLLMDYKQFYLQHQVDNDSGSPVNTMFLDHRLRREPYLQQQLLRYFQISIQKDQCNEPLPFKSSTQLAVEFMQDLVRESPWKMQDEILTRYRNEAPTHLQTNRRQDLLELLQKVAVREKRDDDIRPKWYLQEITADLVGFQPQRGRRSEKRRRAQGEQSNDEIDDVLVSTGITFETQWLENVKLSLNLM